MTVPARLFSAALGLAVLLAGCANSTPGLPPPGTSGGGPSKLFYPISVAVDPSGDTLYIANSNFDLAFNKATLVSVKTSLFTSGQANVPFPTDPSQYSLVTTDSLGGNLVLSDPAQVRTSVGGTACTGPSQPRLYLTTRENATLTSAAIASDGTLECPNNDCSSDAVYLGNGSPNFVDPFALRLACMTPPGATAPQDVVVVSHLSQYPTSTDGIGLDTSVAVLPEPTDTSTAGKPFSHVSYTVDIGQPGSDSLAIGPGNQLLVGGCYLLVPGGSDISCLTDTNNPNFIHENPLRYFFLDSGPGAVVNTVPMGPTVGTINSGGGLITDLAISSDGNSLYIAIQQPNVLLITGFPQPGSNAPPPVHTIINLADTPQRILVLPRYTAGGMPAGDLIAVAATPSNALLIVDPTLGAVVSQIDPVGQEPFGMASIRIPTASDPAGTPVGNRVFVALFNDCGVAAVDVPDAVPEQSVLRAVLGQSCAAVSQQQVQPVGNL